MRRYALVFPLALGAALALTAVAYAGNGGVAPLPPHSPNADRIDQSYLWISIFAIVILVVVEGALILFIYKYRSRGRPRTVEGPQIHGATRLELIWTAIPVLILTAIASFVLYKLPGIKDVPSANADGGRIAIRVDAHQFYWQYTYPNGAVSIDELHAPVNRVVSLDIVSHDVDHSWWVPELNGKFDAIPGRTNHTWFKADRIGVYRGRCGEFCGVFHAAMESSAKIESQGAYDAWVSGQADADLGKSEFVGACAKCHGLSGRGGYGPAIFNNSRLIQQQSLRTLLLNGQNIIKPLSSYMPPVSRGWTEKQFQALLAYLKSDVYKGPSSGG